MLSKELSYIIQRGFEVAFGEKSEYLTLEHIFLALISNESGQAMLADLGADPDEMIADLKRHLAENLEIATDAGTKKYRPIETPALSRVFTDMLTHVESSGKQEATAGDFLAAIFAEENSYACYLLKKANIERLDVLEYVTEEDQPEVKESKQSDKKVKFLEQFATNLTTKAEMGEVDPVIGRNKELLEMVRTLGRKKKNNPLLVGESGVGKTAMVDLLAAEVAAGRVPDFLHGTQIYSVDLGSVVAGTKYRGEFEKRLKGILAELNEIPNAILFIDEIHNIIGAGSASGSMDASSMLKPILSDGKLRCIGATTYSEFKKFFDKEKALTRRFEKIDIAEPDSELTIEILTGLKEHYEKFHGVTYTPAAIKKAVDLSVKYIQNRYLPDKAIDLLDEAGVKRRMENSHEPISDIDIENLVAEKLNIPSKIVSADDQQVLISLDSDLKSRIFGQNHAIEQLVSAIKRNKAGLNEAEKPIGSFLFTGPSGVGKTALAKEMADLLRIGFVRFDMSEYMEKHTVSRLIGAPAGYVGYEEGGLLTEAIRKHPHCVLLLDEIEKAHVDALNILLQIMDNSSLTDTGGIKVDFKNVVLIMTSNLGSKETRQIGFNQDGLFTSDNAVKKFFSPEFRNRLDGIVHFNALSKDVVKSIVKKFIAKLADQVKERKVSVKISTAAVDYLAEKGYSTELGARPLSRLIQEEIKTPLTDMLLFGELKNGGVLKIECKKEKIVLKVN